MDASHESQPSASVGRRTFIVQRHSDGLMTLENALTRERVRVDRLASVGAQIERWLAEPGSRGAGRVGGQQR